MQFTASPLSLLPRASAPRREVERSPAPETFVARFCDEHACTLEDFLPAVMKACATRRGRPFLAFFGHTRCFAADRELIAAVAYAVAMEDVRDAIDDYWAHPANRAWWRRIMGLRISTRRLRRLAADCLPLEKPRRRIA